jgi:PAS domain S-box-containing protein
LRYVEFTDDDARRVVAFGAVAAPHFERISREFYDKIREHEDAHAVFSGEEQITRLQQSLVRWMKRFCSGKYDAAYFEETAKIGQTHVRVGLPQRYMFSAMALIRLAFERIADEKTFGADAPATRDAVSRLLDVELAMMLESYHAAFLARVQRAERNERDELDRTLRRTEHRYESAVELARTLVIGIDAEGKIRLFNQEAERVTGWGRDEVLGESFVERLVAPDTAESFGTVVSDAIAGRRPQPDIIECIVRARNGKYRDVRWQLAYAPSKFDDEVVVFAIGQDTTDANLLAERTRHHEKLAAVGTLAAGLAHEIRNPLNGAQLHVSFLERALKKTGASQETLEAVGVVGDEIKRLAALVSEFLDFARPKPPRLEPTSVRELCERAVQLVLPRAAAAHVSLTSDLPTRDVTVQADAAKMEQVLLNLLGNAIEAISPTGSASTRGHVVLRVRRQPRRVVFEVEDDGPGLPSPDAPIFDAFFSTKPDGTGLGLAITHRIISDHGGDIDVESRPGRTIFRVSIPVEPE